MFGYLGHNLGNRSMTCDPANVTPGAVYIDLKSKDRRGIYNASKKGASLIISNRSISNPAIPMIRVKDIEETYLNLLNLIYGRPLDKANLIYIYGGNKGKLVLRLLKEIFAEYFSKPIENIEMKELTNFIYSLLSEKITSAAEKFFYYILLNLSNSIKIIPLSYSNDLARFQSILKNRYDCGILIDESLVQETEICSTGSGKSIFVNIDNPNIIKAIGGQNDNIVITYGLNKKAAVTATSIEYGEITKFNYCLQRTFYTKSGSMLEPFEVPLSIKGLGISKIYSCLAAISCALYYDVSLECIKRALSQLDDKDRDFSITKYNNFILIDSYCINEQDYREAFEMLPMMDYRNLHIIVSALTIQHNEIYNIVQDLINEWGMSLNIKELNILYGEKKDTPFENTELLNDIRINYFDQLSKAIESSMMYLSDKDVLLILGGDEMNSSQCIIELMLSK